MRPSFWVNEAQPVGWVVRPSSLLQIIRCEAFIMQQSPGVQPAFWSGLCFPDLREDSRLNVSDQLHLICRGGIVNPIFCPSPGDGICLIVELGRTISFKHIPEKKVLDEHLPCRVPLDESNPSSVAQRFPN
jgi:hypothetical protein